MITHPTGIFDNSAKAYKHIDVIPLSAAMGAKVSGVDLSCLTDDQFIEIEDALFRHKMIYFRDQHITHGDQEAFSLRFGPFGEDAYTKGVDGHVNVQPIIREANGFEPLVFGFGWHTDSPFLPRPPAISMLYAVDIPPFGGDTIWANSALAYHALSETMRSIIDPLSVHMSMEKVVTLTQKEMSASNSLLGRIAATKDMDNLPEAIARKVAGSFHPLVRTHPRTGEKSIYCDRTYSSGIKGLSRDEAQPILDFLIQHITQPAFTCRLRWKENTLTVWDNRLGIHQAFNDYNGFRREMYRTTVAGEVPV